jgi:hypothetical protein
LNRQTSRLAKHHRLFWGWLHHLKSQGQRYGLNAIALLIDNAEAGSEVKPFLIFGNL